MIYTNRNIIVDKIINQILSRKNIIWTKISPEKICRKLYTDKNLVIDVFKNRLHSVTGYNKKTFDISPLSDSDKYKIIEYADYALRHEFNVLGSGWIKVEPLNWKCDFIHGFSWEEMQFYSNYQLVSPSGGRDIKVVWELNRCHHLLWLAEAYSITRNKIYAGEVVNQLNNWIDSNPLMYSINWTCSMDVAIRAVNWIYALSMISSTSAFTEKFSKKVEESLYEHLFFIANNLEKTIPNSGNHYLSDIVGMLFISSLFPHNKFAKACKRFAIKEFYREALIELNDDGSNYENSVSYHRLVTELFLFAYNLLNREGLKIPTAVEKKIFYATQYIAEYTKDNEVAPLFGDNDNGRFLPFVPRDYRKHLYLKDLGDYLFTSKKVFCGEKVFGNILSSPSNLKYIPPKVFSSGLTALENDRAKLLVTNGGFSLNRGKSIGQWAGTHTHCDNCSFELNINKTEFFVDPGTFVYTSDPKKRRVLQSASSHNTILIDGLDFAGFSESSAFTMQQHLRNRILIKQEDGIIGSYEYDDGKLEYSHSRKFDLGTESLLIQDTICCKGKHKASVIYLIHPDIKVTANKDIIILESIDCKATIQVIADNSELQSTNVEEWPYSPSYGILHLGHRIKFDFEFSDSDFIKTSIKWRIKE